MDRLATLQLFVRVLELGSFTRAAGELGLGQPAVSKQIASLEARLGTRLLDRSPRGLRPTAAGLDLYSSSVRLLAELEETETRVRDGGLELTGTVRIATPPALGRMYIVPSLPAFFRLHPGITIELSVDDRRVDLVREGVDVALRVGALADSTLVARRIGSLQMITVATPGYLAEHGNPTHPRDLAGHRLITGQIAGAEVEWDFSDGGLPVSLSPAGVVRSNDGEDLRAAVLAGIGISQGPSALFRSDLQDGQVVQLLEDFVPNAVPIHAVSSDGRKMTQRARVFVDHLAATFEGEPSLRRGPHYSPTE
jgi:LysR family transcriptional regulator for bpeEF and oprC